MKILGFGEILWDIIEGQAHIGGAVFNLTAHIAKMGADASIVSSVGDDDLGRKALQVSVGYGIATSFISTDPEAPTGTVDVSLDGEGHPEYIIHEGVAWDRIRLSEANEEMLGSTHWDAFCIGTLAQRGENNRKTLDRLLPMVEVKEVLYDLNLRQHFFQKDWIERLLGISTIVKLNDDEAAVLSNLLFDNDLEHKTFSEKLAERFQLSVILLTKGADGALVFDGRGFHTSYCQDVPIVDTVGAGDSFSAGFLFAYLSGSSAFEAADFAGRVADVVVSKRGAVPEYPPELVEEIESIAMQKKNG